MSQPAADDPLGVWQAWIVDAAGEDERDRRVARVPEPLRQQAERHLTTVRSLEAFYRRGKSRGG